MFKKILITNRGDKFLMAANAGDANDAALMAKLGLMPLEAAE